jgi:hypothetical protein
MAKYASDLQGVVRREVEKRLEKRLKRREKRAEKKLPIALTGHGHWCEVGIHLRMARDDWLVVRRGWCVGAAAVMMSGTGVGARGKEAGTQPAERHTKYGSPSLVRT